MGGAFFNLQSFENFALSELFSRRPRSPAFQLELFIICQLILMWMVIGQSLKSQRGSQIGFSEPVR